jgi:hypothetical protein
MASKKQTSDLRLGWHFLPEDGKLSYSDSRKVVVGQTLSIPDNLTPDPCYRGMHASEDLCDAAQYNRGPIICRVEVWGDVKVATDKFCGRHRKVLWMHKLTKAEIVACCKAAGYKVSPSGMSTDDLIEELSSAAGYNPDAVRSWMESLAQQLGCPGLNPKKKYTINLTYCAPELTAGILKALLNDRLVQTYDELEKQVKDVYDEDTFEDAFLLLADEDDVIVLDSYGPNYQDGYVLKRKAPKRKR